MDLVATLINNKITITKEEKEEHKKWLKNFKRGNLDNKLKKIV